FIYLSLAFPSSVRFAPACLIASFPLHPSGLLRSLPSFPTRRSSDLDYAIIYPTAGLRMPRIADDPTRRAVIRAHNIVTADYFRRSEEHTSELQSPDHLVCRLLLEKKKKKTKQKRTVRETQPTIEICI